MTVYLRQPTAVEDKPQRYEISKSARARQLGGNSFYRSVGKTFLDYLLVLASLPVAVPLVSLFAFLIALDGAAPFYRQRRVGRNGKVFNMVKLRTMVPDAEHFLQEYLENNPAARSEWDRKQKLCNDPRITRFGWFLRKTSIDELPQLWNVLRGEMSLVGPRPMMVDQQALYPGGAYYCIRPGITGLWQVSDRNLSDFAERSTFDTDYYNSLSLKVDLSILIRTVGVVLRGTGY